MDIINKENIEDNEKWIEQSMEICNGTFHKHFKEINVFISNTNVDFPKDTHIHNDFEFMAVKRQNINDVVCDENIIKLPMNCAIMFNPMQKHGLNKATSIKQFVCIAFSKDYANNIAKQYYNINNLVFQNSVFEINFNLNCLLGILFNKLLFEQKHNKKEQILLLQLIFMEIMNSNFCKEKTGGKSVAITRAINYLENHLYLNFNLNELAKASGISKYYLIRKFKEEMGITPQQFLLNKKIDKAKSLLINTQKSITEISEELCFSTSSHFCLCFKKLVGNSPTEYKKIAIK